MAPSRRLDIDSFLRNNRMHPRDIDMRACTAAFLREMERGLQGKPSSLAMLPTFIETAGAVQAGRKVIALDAGGTNLRAAVVSFDGDGRPTIERLVKHRMPGAGDEIGRDEFFRALASFVVPLADASDRIGFCFSYPAEMTPERDGRLIHFTKEVKVRGMEGELIGAGLARAMTDAGARSAPRVVLLNDTVAALLAGRRPVPGRRFDGFIGFVCGTGVNTSYIESNSAINLEAGAFAKAPAGRLDDEFDAGTEFPGKYRYEKMVSGGYLGNLCLLVLKAACRAGCLSPAAGRAINGASSLSTKDVNDFLLFPDAAQGPLSVLAPDDADAAAVLLDRLVERSAALAAVNLCAVLLKGGGGRDPRAPVRITADGTTFWQMKDYRLRVEARMRAFLVGKNERHYEIAAVDDAPLIGAAIAALTN
jgi:hexokinase